MNRKQVFALLSLIRDAYPHFTIDQNKIDHWTKLLQDQNPNTMIRHTEQYIREYRYPPTVADLRETRLAAHRNEFLAQRQQWEREAIGHEPRS